MSPEKSSFNFPEDLTELERDHKQSQTILKTLFEIFFPGMEDDDAAQEKRRQKSLPHW